MAAKKVAVSATGESLEAAVDPRFGRTEYFVLYDLENDSWEAIKNPAAYEARGAGIAAATFLVEKGVEAVITGNCGPKAFAVLAAAGVKVYPFSGGSVSEAIEQFKQGKLSAVESPNVDSHFGGGMPGMGKIAGGGMGRGMGGGGRGMGGGGRGMGGCGMGRGQGGGRGQGRGGW